MMLERAKDLRCHMTEAGNRMWSCLRDRRLNGYKFVREQVIGSYIADFVCRSKKLIIELDGSQHHDAQQYDAYRTEILNKQGYRVLRVWNHDVFSNLPAVMNHILHALDNVPSSPPSSALRAPSPTSGRRK